MNVARGKNRKMHMKVTTGVYAVFLFRALLE